MQDSFLFQAAKPAELTTDQQDQQLKCPRCDSTNTKFCYYNNYNLSQPRHFCKNCRRYWTKGGALRNIPIGGGSRKNSKRSSSSSSANSPAKRPTPPPSSDPLPAPVLNTEPVSALYPAPIDPDDKMLEITGSFSSLLQSSAHFAANLNFLDGFDSAGSSDSGVLTRTGETPNPDPHSQQQPENFLGWVGVWPDLAIYTSPGSNIQ